MDELYFIVSDFFRGTYTSRVIVSFFEILWLVAPYFIASVLINALLRLYLMNKSVKFTTGWPWFDVLIAAFAGIISPFPTYIAVPMAFSLLLVGIRFNVIFTFMLASPLMNPGIFYLTWSQLGLEIAVARVVAAFVIAVTGGFILGNLIKRLSGKLEKKIKMPAIKKRSFWAESWHSLRFIGKYFLIALFLSAVVKSIIPIETVSRFLGGNAPFSVITAMALGIPFYSCGGAAIPLVEILSEMGMNKGAVLAFFTAGPATKPETLYVFKSVFGGYHIIIIYLVFSLLGAYLCGITYLFI